MTDDDEQTTEQPWARHDLQDPAGGPLQREGVARRSGTSATTASGWAARDSSPQILLTEVPAGADALGPENKLVFALSPVTGTPVYATGRNGVGAKSPLSGGIALCQVGRALGRRAEEGRLRRPHRGGQGREAGLPLHQGRRGHHPRRRRAVGSADQRDAGGHPGGTGRPAGPRRHDRTRRREPRALRLHHERALRRRRPRRPGGGHGLEEPQGHRRARHRPAARLRPRGREGLQHLADQGALGATSGCSRCCRSTAPAGRRWRAWRRSAIFRCTTGGGLRSPRASRTSTAARSRSRMGLAQEGCFGCPLRCKKRLKSGAPYFVDPEYGGPEYEAMCGLGTNCEVDDPEAMVKANELCNAYSLDVISVRHHHLVRHGVLREGPADPRGHRGPRAALRQRPGAGEVRGAHRQARGHRRSAGARARRRGGQEDRPRGGGALGGGEGRPSGHARTAPQPRLRPRLHGQPQRRRPLRQRARRPLRRRARHARTSTSLGFYDTVPFEDIGPRKVALFKVGHIREFLNDCLLTCHLAYVGVTFKHARRDPEQGHRLGRQRRPS